MDNKLTHQSENCIKFSVTFRDDKASGFYVTPQQFVIKLTYENEMTSAPLYFNLIICSDTQNWNVINVTP